MTVELGEPGVIGVPGVVTVPGLPGVVPGPGLGQWTVTGFTGSRCDPACSEYTGRLTGDC